MASTIEALSRRILEKPGIAQVRFSYYGGGLWTACAMPGRASATALAVADFEAKGVASVTLAELSDATILRMNRATVSGKGPTPDDAVRALFVNVFGKEPG